MSKTTSKKKVLDMYASAIAAERKKLNKEASKKQKQEEESSSDSDSEMSVQVLEPPVAKKKKSVLFDTPEQEEPLMDEEVAFKERISNLGTAPEDESTDPTEESEESKSD